MQVFLSLHLTDLTKLGLAVQQGNKFSPKSSISQSIIQRKNKNLGPFLHSAV